MKSSRLSFLLSLSVSILVFACSETKKTVKTEKPATTSTSTTSVSQKRQRITNYAQQYVGAAYKYSGTSPSTGFDCSGFTSYVLKEFKIKLSPGSTDQSKQGKKVDLDRVQPGDLIFFGDDRHIQHVAMVVERKKAGIICVHSTTSRGVVVENVSASKYWKPLILFARDVIGG